MLLYRRLVEVDEEGKRVLILIVVEYALIHIADALGVSVATVLILIVVEYALIL